jgi:hypothetical protein
MIMSVINIGICFWYSLGINEILANVGLIFAFVGFKIMDWVVRVRAKNEQE